MCAFNAFRVRAACAVVAGLAFASKYALFLELQKWDRCIGITVNDINLFHLR